VIRALLLSHYRLTVKNAFAIPLDPCHSIFAFGINLLLVFNLDGKATDWQQLPSLWEFSEAKMAGRRRPSFYFGPKQAKGPLCGNSRHLHHSTPPATAKALGSARN